MKSTPSKLSHKPLLIAITILALLATFIKLQFKAIEVVPASAAETVFSAERAFNQLQYLTSEQVPHSVDSAANRVVEQRLVELLQQMGYQQEIQDTLVCRDDTRGRGHCARVRNIIIKIAGSKPGKAILLSAHYDSAVSGPGASDAGAAVGTLLETARLLALSPPPLNSIILLFNEGEEFGLLGAKAFMEKHPLAKNIQVAINIEARGSSGQSVMFETGENSGWLVNHYAQTTPAPLSSSLFYEVYKFLPNDTDLTIYKQHGLQGLNFAHGERLPHYHTPMDNLLNLDKGSLQHHGDNVWGVLNRIKDINLDEVKQGNLVYTDVMGLFVVQWQESSSLLISLLLVFLLIMTIYFFNRAQRFSVKQLFIGIFAVLVVILVAAVSAYIIHFLVQTFSASLTPWYSNELPMRLALWLGVLLSGIVVGKWLIRHATVIDVSLSLACVWTCLSVLTSLMMPGVSFLFIIPAVAALFGLAAIAWLDRLTFTKQTTAQLQLAILIIMASISAISFMTVAYVLEVLVTYKIAVAIGIILSFAVCPLLPLLAIEKASNDGFKKTSYGIAVLMFASIGWTSWQVVYTAWMPQHLNLNYVQNENNDGFVLIGHEKNKVPAKLISTLATQAQLVEILPWSKLSYYSASAQANLLKPVQLKVLETVESDSGKKVTVSIVAPGDNFHELRVFIPTDSSLASIDMGDEVISYIDEPSIRNGFYEFRCRGAHCAQVQLTLNFDQSIQSKLVIASVYPGLPTPYMSLLEARGSAAVPYRSGDQSIVFSEFSL